MSDSSISNVSARPVYTNSNTNSVNEAKTNTEGKTAKSESSQSLPIVKDNAEGVTQIKLWQMGICQTLMLKPYQPLKAMV